MLIGKFNHLFTGDKTKLLFFHKQTSMEFRFYSQYFCFKSDYDYC